MDKFIFGVCGGILISICIILIVPSTIISHKRIIPEWRLKTDGKVVDTLYIYKNE
jgi:hypothetical protein